MPNGSGPIPERPVDFSEIKAGVCVTSGPYKGCIQVGEVYYWLSRKPDSPFYWVHNTDAPGETMVPMTTGVWDNCKDGGEYDYDYQLQGWVDGEDVSWRWDGQPGKPIFLSNDFKP